MFLNEKNPVKVANRIVEENFSKQLNEMQPNITRRLLENSWLKKMKM